MTNDSDQIRHSIYYVYMMYKLMDHTMLDKELHLHPRFPACGPEILEASKGWGGNVGIIRFKHKGFGFGYVTDMYATPPLAI